MTVATPSVTFGQWKVLLVCPNGSLIEELSPLLAAHLPFSPALELRQYPPRAVLAEALQNQGANICFVDVSVNQDSATALLGELCKLDPKLPIVAIHQGNDPNYIIRTLRQGATEFLFRPVTAEHFIPVMERLSASRGGTGVRQSKIYCVMPAKGACGASTVACNLAYYCGKAGAGKVLLVDLDPLTGTISFQLKLRQGYSFMEALNRGHHLDEDIWKGLVVKSSGIDILLAPDQPVHAIGENYSAGAILEFARSLYDIIVVDTASAYGQWSHSIARGSDEILLITTNELPALQSTQRALAYLERSQIDHVKISVIVNRYHEDIGLSSDMIGTALHTDVFHLIPSDYEGVQRALVDGKPIPSSTPVGKALMKLAGKLTGMQRPAPPPKTSPLAGLFSFLRR